MNRFSIPRILYTAAVLVLLSAAIPTAVFASGGSSFRSFLPAVAAGPQRINFASGATSAAVSGSLAANSSARYVLRAMAGQLMDVTLSAPSGASLSVTTADGRILTPMTSSSSGFRGVLPISGDYLITVKSAGQAVNYSVNVMIPVRVAFAVGATSALLQGHLAASQSIDYVLRAGAGQIIEINGSPDNSFQLIIYGADGTVLKSGMGEGSSFRGLLPSSQDYIVTVRAGAKEAAYTLNVIIPRRISFAAGSTGATLGGKVSASQSQYYVLKALNNQTMDVKVTSVTAVQLIIYGADGTVLRSGMGEGSSFSGKLPSTQDYIVVVRARVNPASYTLRVTIP